MKIDVLRIIPLSYHGIKDRLWFHILKIVCQILLFFLLFFMIFSSSLGLMLFLFYVFMGVRGSVKIAFADPEDINYVRKTDRELYTFVFFCCIMAAAFAVLSFQVLLYISLVFWTFYLMFVLMFTRVWKFHGKKRLHLFVILGGVTVLSFAAAPFIRDWLYGFLISMRLL